MPWPQSLSYKNQNESLKAVFFLFSFKVNRWRWWIFFVFRTRRAKTQGRFFEKSGFLDFFHFAIFLLVLVYWILHDGKIIFSPKKILFQTSLNMSKLVQIGFFFLSAVARGLIFLSGSIVVVSLKANNFYRDFTDLC